MNGRSRVVAILAALVVLLGAAAGTDAQQTLAVKFVSITAPVRPGADATLVVSTSPGAACVIVVYYKSGPSRARGLVPKTASADGRVVWTWRVGTRTTPGTWPIVVSCSRGSRSGTLETSLDVI